MYGFYENVLWLTLKYKNKEWDKYRLSLRVKKTPDYNFK